jgi:hypothetical protein
VTHRSDAVAAERCHHARLRSSPSVRSMHNRPAKTGCLPRNWSARDYRPERPSIGRKRIPMKHLANALAVLSLFAAAPAFASDVSSDRDFAETRALQSRALQSSRTEAQGPNSRKVKAENRASRCGCARSDDPQAVRAEPGHH